MNELEMQKLIVDAVNAPFFGGFAYKMSHRFLVGVVDVMVKLPGYPAGVLEVKQRVKPRHDHHQFEIEATVQQKRFLRRAWDAGMPAGVASFMQTPGKGKRGLWLGVWTLRAMEVDAREGAWFAPVGAHEPLHGKNSGTVEENIIVMLHGWLQNCRSLGRG